MPTGGRFGVVESLISAVSTCGFQTATRGKLDGDITMSNSLSRLCISDLLIDGKACNLLVDNGYCRRAETGLPLSSGHLLPV